MDSTGDDKRHSELIDLTRHLSRQVSDLEKVKTELQRRLVMLQDSSAAAKEIASLRGKLRNAQIEAGVPGAAHDAYLILERAIWNP